jgi:hypothetical protein
MSEELIIERDIELDIDIAEAWELISTPDGWSTWLVDGADMSPDGDGTVVTDDAERIVHIEEMIIGIKVGFRWWDRHDPSSVSYVQLDVVELEGGRSLLRTSERFVGSLTMSGVQWDVRMVSLWLHAVSHFAIA